VVEAAPKGDDRVFISVTDEGPGIPPDKRRTVFGKFEQLDSTAQGHRGGTGLGLSIAKNIVEVHGGQIGVDANPRGCGSRFFFVLTRRAGAGD
jgi:Signal transduction histidine kinase